MAVEGRTWNLNLRLSFFLGRGVRKYKSPGHVTVPVPHIPFATRSGARRLSVLGYFFFGIFESIEMSKLPLGG